MRNVKLLVSYDGADFNGNVIMDTSKRARGAGRETEKR